MKYTKKLIYEAINYWNKLLKQINESQRYINEGKVADFFKNLLTKSFIYKKVEELKQKIHDAKFRKQHPLLAFAEYLNRARSSFYKIGTLLFIPNCLYASTVYGHEDDPDYNGDFDIIRFDPIIGEEPEGPKICHSVHIDYIRSFMNDNMKKFKLNPEDFDLIKITYNNGVYHVILCSKQFINKKIIADYSKAEVVW